jgi:pimeloyl-ACP methyl ester carboxylesterase
MKMLYALLLLCLSFAGCATGGSQGANPLVMEEFRVPSDPGIQIYVRNKRPADMKQFSGNRTVLFVHGATYPAETSFDLKLNGLSWMDYIAQHGYDVYLLDVRGYGLSTRPAQMDRPAQENPPFATTEDAVRDVAAVVEFIRKKRGVERVNLIGWSWGTRIMQWYTSLNSDKVEKLVLYAPAWIRKTASLAQAGPGPLGAYRSVRMDQAKGRWLTGVADAKKTDLIPDGWFEAWAAATLATDPVGARQSPPVVRAPNGVLLDAERYWNKGVIPYRVEDIRVPVLLIKAEWDQDTPAYMSQDLFPLLVNAPYKRYIELGEGTHTIIMEKNRMSLFREVQLFLDEKHQASR